MTDQFEKELPPSQNGGVKKASDDIEILHTGTLIKEVFLLKILSLLIPQYVNFHVFFVLPFNNRCRKCWVQITLICLKSERQRKCLRLELTTFEAILHCFPHHLSMIIALLLIMQEHEQALMDVISKLADASDSESGNKYIFT